MANSRWTHPIQWLQDNSDAVNADLTDALEQLKLLNQRVSNLEKAISEISKRQPAPTTRGNRRKTADKSNISAQQTARPVDFTGGVHTPG